MYEQIKLLQKGPDILLESTEMNTIRDAALARFPLILRPHIRYIGAKYHHMKVGQSITQPRDGTNQFKLSLPGIHSRCDACDQRVPRNGKSVANRGAGFQFLIRVKMIGIDGIVNRKYFVRRD